MDKPSISSSFSKSDEYEILTNIDEVFSINFEISGFCNITTCMFTLCYTFSLRILFVIYKTIRIVLSSVMI